MIEIFFKNHSMIIDHPLSVFVLEEISMYQILNAWPNVGVPDFCFEVEQLQLSKYISMDCQSVGMDIC